MKEFCFFLLLVWDIFFFYFAWLFPGWKLSRVTPGSGGWRGAHNSSHRWDRVMGREAAPALKSLLGGYALLAGVKGSKKYILSLKSADLRMNTQIYRKLLVLRAPLMCDHTLTWLGSTAGHGRDQLFCGHKPALTLSQSKQVPAQQGKSLSSRQERS